MESIWKDWEKKTIIECEKNIQEICSKQELVTLRVHKRGMDKVKIVLDHHGKEISTQEGTLTFVQMRALMAVIDNFKQQ
jgi:hypothetical protein